MKSKIFLLDLIFFLSILSILSFAQAYQAPEGWLDAVDCSSFWGWARDPGTTDPINVHFYADNYAEIGTYLGMVEANQYRSDLCDLWGNGDLDCYHGFVFSTPDSLKDGNPHKIYAYGVDNGRAVLNGCPKTITCDPPGCPPCNNNAPCTCDSGGVHYYCYNHNGVWKWRTYDETNPCEQKIGLCEEVSYSSVCGWGTFCCRGTGYPGANVGGWVPGYCPGDCPKCDDNAPCTYDSGDKHYYCFAFNGDWKWRQRSDYDYDCTNLGLCGEAHYSPTCAWGTFCCNPNHRNANVDGWVSGSCEADCPWSCLEDFSCRYYYIWVPVGDKWINDEHFITESEKRAMFFVDISPLKFCYNEVGNIYVPLDFRNNFCSDLISMKGDCPNGVLEESLKCANKYADRFGIDYEKAIGLSWGPGGGCTWGGKVVWAGTHSRSYYKDWIEDVNIPAHELGHTYGLCDEYWPLPEQEGGCPNDIAHPQECYDYGYEDPFRILCKGSTPTYRDYSGIYGPLPGVCKGRPTTSIMGYDHKDFSACGYDSTGGYMEIEKQINCGYGLLDIPAIQRIVGLDLKINKNDEVILENFRVYEGKIDLPILEKSDYVLKIINRKKSVVDSINLPVSFFIFDAPEPETDDAFLSVEFEYKEDLKTLEIYRNDNLIFKKDIENLFCNNNKKCEKNENHISCPQDCPSGYKDGYCDGIMDKRCDPDCQFLVKEKLNKNPDIDCKIPRSKESPSLPIILECSGRENKCSISNCEKGLWIVSGKPLDALIIKSIATNPKLEFIPEREGKILVRALCFKPSITLKSQEIEAIIPRVKNCMLECESVCNKIHSNFVKTCFFICDFCTGEDCEEKCRNCEEKQQNIYEKCRLTCKDVCST